MSTLLIEANDLATYISTLAYQALIDEVSSSPKPGLVCPAHSGSHIDMDYQTFLMSAKVLRPYFYKTTEIGYQFAYEPHTEVMARLRLVGRDAEKTMFTVTEGVNTHKGVIFSLGLLTAAYGRLYALNMQLTPESIAQESALFVPDLVKSVLEPLKRQQPKRKLTSGERFFLEYGITGIHGEAETGFPSAINALQVLTEITSSHSFAIAMPHTLLHLMTTVPDTNVLSRAGKSGLLLVQNQAKNALQLGGMLTTEGSKAMWDMSDLFPVLNISPGGSADLLAIAAFLLSIQHQ